MLELSNSSHFLEQKSYKYQLQDVAEPQLYRDAFSYAEPPKIPFNHRRVPMNMPEHIWITDTTFRDGQQSMEPFTVRQIVDLYIGVGKPKVFRGKIAALFPGKPYPVLFEVQDPLFPGAQFGCSGSVIVQDGRIAAVVAGANENPATLLYCTSAEQMVVDLYRMVHDFAITKGTSE